MNREAIQEILSNKLDDITFINNTNILIGKRFHNQSLVGTYYIDFTEDNIDFDIREYHEKYISTEYYKHPGHLQWNYYLIFVRTQYEESKKLLVEKDDIYTRKFVFTPDELKKYFDYQKSDKSVDADIINTWKERLKEVDLDEVYSDTPYAQAIPRYLSNTEIKDVDIEQQSSENTNTNLTIEKISTLQIKDSYREYPVQKNFALGSVNLIKGVNGSGKTSFLESIELIVAGKSYRDPSFSEENNCIEVTYNNNDNLKDSYTPNDNTKYRERDIAWYSSAYKTGNELFRAFNKYNFYDSDAAYNLSYNSDVGTLSKYLSSIALGAEFNRIQSRLKGFNERLGKECRDRKKIIDEENNRSLTANKTLEGVKSSSNPQLYFNSYLTYAKEIKWLKNFPQKIDDSYAIFEEDYQTTQSVINSLNQLLVTIKLRNLKSWNEELSKVEKAIVACNENKIKITTHKNSIEQQSNLIKDISSQLEILETAKKYFQDIASFNLLELDNKMAVVALEIKKASRVTELVDEISDQNIFTKSIVFSELKKTTSEKRNNLIDESNKIKLQIESLKLNLDKLQGIVSEIKSYGKQYIAINTDATECPLCDAHYSQDELSERISKIAENIKENSTISTHNDKLIEINVELVKIERTIKDIAIIEKSMSNIYLEEEYLQLSLEEIQNIIKTVKSKALSDNSEQLKLITIKQELEDKGFFENEFNNVKLNIEIAFPDLKFESTHNSLFEEIYNRTKKQNNDLLKTIEIEKDSLSKLDKLQQNIILEVAPTVNYLDYERELAYRIEILKTGLNNFSKLKEFINYLETEDLSDIQQKIDKLFKLLTDLKKSIVDQKELQLANQIIEESAKKIGLLEPEYKKLERGLLVINDILDNQGESKTLSSFIESNEQEIQEIFQNIHAPKEFSKIIFDSQLNTVMLKKRVDNTDVPIFKISTGQRSALALSIFIALNKKLKHGPYLMLFDDPVTYTDDLNILSFLDYLRELVINENRQIVFATANQKLASLFEKKFLFLGNEEFKVFPFER